MTPAEYEAEIARLHRFVLELAERLYAASSVLSVLAEKREMRGRNQMDENPLAKPLTSDDVCPKCLGELDTGWECNDCGYDARPHVMDDRRAGRTEGSEGQGWK